MEILKDKKKTIIVILSIIVGIVLLVVGYKSYTISRYEKEVSDVVSNYYNTLKEVDERLRNDNYTSLTELLKKLKTPTEEFEKLEVNMDSKLGVYINEVRSNLAYQTLNKDFLFTNASVDFDYGLVSWGYAYAAQTYTELILEIEFPDVR